MSTWTSRERMLAALNCECPDRTPCSFMMFNALKAQCRTYEEFVERQIEMGLDTVVELPPRPPVVANDWYNLHGLDVNFDPRVQVNEWIEHPADEPCPVMVKEYHTPGGVLRTEVRQSEGWRWGNHVPLFDDYLVPRTRKHLVAAAEDLEALRYLLVAPTDAHVAALNSASFPVLDLARREQLLVAGGWGAAADIVAWLVGFLNMMFFTVDQPDLMHTLLDMIAEWNRRRMEVLLGAGIDLYIKRAWYENLDFWTPRTYREFLLPVLKQDARLAHERGAKFGYIITSNCMQLLGMMVEAGVDVLIGADPRTMHLPSVRKVLSNQMCVWGGVNGHLTIEEGTAADVRSEVQQAVRVFGADGGFILSPVDNVRSYAGRAQENVQAMLDEWRLCWHDGASVL